MQGQICVPQPAVSVAALPAFHSLVQTPRIIPETSCMLQTPRSSSDVSCID